MNKKELCSFLEPFRDDLEIITTDDKLEFGPFTYELKFMPIDIASEIKAHIRIHRTGSVIV